MVITAPSEFFKVIVSPVLFKDKPFAVSVIPGIAVGVPPPKTTIDPPAGIEIVPKVCLIPVPSDIV